MLIKIDPVLKNKRIGAWQAFNSDNPDKLSQSANSMVELLDKLISNLCDTLSFEEYLKNHLNSEKDIKWAESIKKFISETKNHLHRVKHHSNYQNVENVRTLLIVTERLILLLLENR